ncbi:MULTISPECIES: helix-turn-helix domain-containing protein [Bacillaceae]|uniref:helix-turn-helix domain-containing protein n=1 Tax=Bacillaceae TaxID=186817 RepID=UPI00077C6372|nr:MULTISPECIES: helix-turn-helix domain-containing protein [Bacillaceae]AQX53346.1 hypothetical protein BC359_02855 [Priestia flexa]MCG7314923.1 helix-turn-helix domain-containing protein [Priestia flexa]MED4588629.1 helix-turn-helix domain-containing protein [Priestia flexa]TDB51758.1 hypothetical protein EPL02_08395 [Bacillus sp. CBEL-1]
MYKIHVKLAEAMESRGIHTQKELLALIKEKTGETLRAATVSDMYNNKSTNLINRKYLEIIATALEIQNIGELIELDTSETK